MTPQPSPYQLQSQALLLPRTSFLYTQSWNAWGFVPGKELLIQARAERLLPLNRHLRARGRSQCLALGCSVTAEVTLTLRPLCGSSARPLEPWAGSCAGTRCSESANTSPFCRQRPIPDRQLCTGRAGQMLLLSFTISFSRTLSV